MSQFLFKKDQNYPSLLKNISCPPQKLFYEGNLEILKEPCISVVGTRKYSEYGREVTKKIIAELAGYEVVIVSGLAKGIDSIAHTEALKNNLKTIAVLGSGLENIYPQENISLAKEIIEKGGLLLSEYEDQAEAISFHFPNRNRIISGISLATVVIEAPEKSGAINTAKHALDQGREVFVIPGDIDRENSQGILNIMRRYGAYPISSGKEIIECLKKQPELIKERQKPRIDPPEIILNVSPSQSLILLNTKKTRGISIDKLANVLKNISIETILSDVSLLEIQGFIKLIDGKIYRTC